MNQNVLGNNIRAIRKAQKKTGVSLAKEINISTGYLHDLEVGRTQPSIPVLSSIARALNVSVDTLMAPPPEQKIALAETDPGEGRKERRLISMDDWIEVPVVSREWTACCGKGIPALDITSGGEPPVRIERSTLHSYDDMRPPFAIRCEGDSLESAGIHDGDRAVINPAEEPAQGCVALVSRAGSLSLKRVYMLPSGDIVLRNDYGSTRLTPEEQERDELCICGAFICGTYGRPPALPL